MSLKAGYVGVLRKDAEKLEKVPGIESIGDGLSLEDGELAATGGGGPSASIAPDFSTETSYSAGDYVFYDGALYKFITDHSAGAWNSEEVTSAVIGSDLEAVSSSNKDKISWPHAVKSVKKNYLRNDASSDTVSTVEFTVNSDGSVKANGTAGARIDFDLCTDEDVLAEMLEQGKVHGLMMSGCTGGDVGGDKYWLQMLGNKPNQSNVGLLLVKDGEGLINAAALATVTKITKIRISVTADTVLSNQMFYPMVRLGAVADNTYTPYIMDNVELARQLDEVLLFEQLDLNVEDNAWYEVSAVKTTLKYKKIKVAVNTSDDPTVWHIFEVPYIYNEKVARTEVVAMAYTAGSFYSKFFSVIMGNDKFSIRFTLSNYSDCHINKLKIYGIK